MGGSASVTADADPFRDVFINEGLADAETQFSSDATLRAYFIDFVTNGSWAKKLVVPDDLISDAGTKSAWNGFGYAFPLRSELSSKPTMRSVPSFQALTTFVGEISSRATSFRTTSFRAASFRGSAKSQREADSVSTWLLCQSMEDARTIVLVALCALFYTSKEFQQWCSPSFSDEMDSVKTRDRRDSASVVAQQDVSSFEPEVGRGTRRLRELFQSAVASASPADLHAYLASPIPRLVSDFRRIVSNLPLRINICKTQGSKKAHMPEVLFATSGKAGVPAATSSKSQRSDKSQRSEKTAQDSIQPGNEKYLDVPQLHSPEYSPEQRELVQDALVKHSSVKLAVRTAYDRCSLQAIQPVRAANGAVQYVLSVEAVDRVVVSQVSNPHYNPVPFQQVEDLLLLLPLLVKTE